MAFVILGVHPIESTQPCHLLEVELVNVADEYKWDEVTQEDESQPQQYWQAVYDEQSLSKNRWVFFFHYLNWDKPLLTPDGFISLPTPSPIPTRLMHIEYVEVD